MRESFEQMVNRDVVVFGDVSKIIKRPDSINVLLENVKVQEGKRIVGYEDHVWLNDYESRNNHIVGEIFVKESIKENDRIGVRGQVRRYYRKNNSKDYDLRCINKVVKK